MKRSQEENETFETFLQRSEILAEMLHLSVEEAAEQIGVSRASFWGYRSGARSISPKAWRKLEAAEKAAGIGVDPVSKKSNEIHVSHLNTPAPDQMADRIERMESQLSRLAAAIEALVEKTTRSLPDHGPDRENKTARKKRA